MQSKGTGLDFEQSLIFLCKVTARERRSCEPRAARNGGISPRISIVIITSWFAIALDEIRTRRILREKTDCKQSSTGQTILKLSGYLAN